MEAGGCRSNQLDMMINMMMMTEDDDGDGKLKYGEFCNIMEKCGNV